MTRFARLMFCLPLLAACSRSPLAPTTATSAQLSTRNTVAYHRVLWGVRRHSLSEDGLDSNLMRATMPIVQEGFRDLGLTDFLLVRGKAGSGHDVVALARYEDEARYGAGNLSSSGRLLASRWLDVFDPERSVAWPFVTSLTLPGTHRAIDFDSAGHDWQKGYTVACWLGPRGGQSSHDAWTTLRDNLTRNLAPLRSEGLRACLASWHEHEGIVFLGWPSFWAYTRTMAKPAGKTWLAGLNRGFVVKSFVNAVEYRGRLHPGACIQVTRPVD
ncbi:MAG: hypothetical protein VKP72_03220 [bacterium]|nr:hypothetical protein [bacterium]